MKKQYSFSQTKASNLCTIPHRLEAFSYQVVIFLGGGVLHSQPQPTFQRLQIAEQNVVDSSLTSGVWASYAARQRFRRSVSSRSFPMKAAFSCHSSVFIGFWGRIGRNSTRGSPTGWFHRHPSRQKTLSARRGRPVRPLLSPALCAGSHPCAGRRRWRDFQVAS